MEHNWQCLHESQVEQTKKKKKMLSKKKDLWKLFEGFYGIHSIQQSFEKENIANEHLQKWEQ